MTFQCVAYVGNQNFSRRRQSQAPRHALEDRRAKLVLERENLPIDCRRSDIEPDGCLPD
jgi:hypothetical protein